MSEVTPIRDPKTDHLLTPQNAVLALIDYQPEQYAGVASVGHGELLANVTMLGRITTAFEVPVVPWALRWVGAFPVDRGKSDRWAIKRALAALNSGIAVAMFPEGTRSRVFALQNAHPGAGLLALSADVVVQPVAITGTERLPFNGSKGKAKGELERDPGHSGAQILFGEPFRIPREIDGRRVTAEEATEILMLEIARMLPEDFRGFLKMLVRVGLHCDWRLCAEVNWPRSAHRRSRSTACRPT